VADVVVPYRRVKEFAKIADEPGATTVLLVPDVLPPRVTGEGAARAKEYDEERMRRSTPVCIREEKKKRLKNVI
jgi:hypothetical protein